MNYIVKFTKRKSMFFISCAIIYHAPSKDTALEALDGVTEKWADDYPNAMKICYKNW